MEKLLRQLNDADTLTVKLVKHFAEQALAKVERINGRISRDLDKLGKFSFLEPHAYEKLREKYRRAHKSRQWLELLDRMKKQNCKGDFLND